jgi:hypothetical protein
MLSAFKKFDFLFLSIVVNWVFTEMDFQLCKIEVFNLLIS